MAGAVRLGSACETALDVAVPGGRDARGLLRQAFHADRNDCLHPRTRHHPCGERLSCPTGRTAADWFRTGPVSARPRGQLARVRDRRAPPWQRLT